MRLVTLAYETAADFLAAYDEPNRTLTATTKTEATLGEQLVVEIAFPKLPNRPLLRTRCVDVLDGALRLQLDDADAATREFLVTVARDGRAPEGATHREYKRFPASLPVRWTSQGKDAVESHVDDLSGGGCFVRSGAPPGVGTPVSLTITAPDDPKPLELTGQVAWVREGSEPGFGVEFDQPESADGRRLRTMLRRALGTGDVDL